MPRAPQGPPGQMKQALGRAMGLVNEMRALGVERNVHTYTALMNVCIKCQECGEALKIFEHMRDVRPRGRPPRRLRAPARRPRPCITAWHFAPTAHSAAGATPLRDLPGPAANLELSEIRSPVLRMDLTARFQPGLPGRRQSARAPPNPSPTPARRLAARPTW